MNGSSLGLRLGLPIIGELGNVASDDLLDGVAGQVEITGYLTNRLPVSVVGLADLTDGFHYQHLLSVSPLSVDSREHGVDAEVGQFWTPITPLSGSLLHADSHIRRNGTTAERKWSS